MFINIGYGNMVSKDEIISITSPDSAPTRRQVQAARDRGTLIECTNGRKALSLIFTKDYIITSILSPKVLSERGVKK